MLEVGDVAAMLAQTQGISVLKQEQCVIYTSNCCVFVCHCERVCQLNNVPILALQVALCQATCTPPCAQA